MRQFIRDDDLRKHLHGLEDSFSAGPHNIGWCEWLQHWLQLASKEPIFRPQYQLTANELQTVTEQTLAWEKAGLVTPMHSPTVKRMFGEIQMVERISVGYTFFNY